MVVDIGQVLDVDANVDRRQGVVWEGIPETSFYEVFENEKKVKSVELLPTMRVGRILEKGKFRNSLEVN